MFKLISVAISILLFSLTTFAEKINIKANSFVSEKDKIVYSGNVYLHTDKGREIYCDRLVIFLNKEGKVQKIMAVGKVLYKDKKYTATGKVMIFYPSENKVVLSGNAVVKSKRGVLQGEKIVYNTKTGRVDVESSVSSVFVIDNSN